MIEVRDKETEHVSSSMNPPHEKDEESNHI
jgi:hypothetical protein